jgi:hypothetical protein
MTIIQKNHLSQIISKILEKEITKKFIDLFYENNPNKFLSRDELKSFIDDLFIEVLITKEDKICLKIISPQLENTYSLYHLEDDNIRSLIKETLDKIIGTDIVQYEGLIEIQHKN